jgi:hypothetical protein
MQVMKPQKPPSGRTIVVELLKEMEERLYPLLYRTVPPGVFHVYLHPDDFREVEPIVPLIVTDAQQGLNARVDELNGRFRWSTLVSGKAPPIEAPAGGWEIHIHADANGELAPGEIGIESQLSLPPPPRYEAGTPTTRIGKTVVTGTIRRSVPSEEANVAPPQAGPKGSALHVTQGKPGADATATADHVTQTSPHLASVITGTARLAYVDDEGPHLFVMRKDLISLGRGGSAHWVDVQLVTTARVSREHCRIRRSPDGRFFLQDVSTWGTSVDGQPVAPYARHADGRVEHIGHEHELPGRAQIQLADAVVIDFKVEP